MEYQAKLISIIILFNCVPLLGNIVAQLESHLQQSPHDYKARIHLADAYDNTDNQIAALKQIHTTIEQVAPSYSLYYNAALMLRCMDRINEAIIYYKKSIELNPTYKKSHVSLAQAYLNIGDFKNGWNELHWRLHNTFYCPKQKWANADLTGKTIIVYSEWGIGDSFQFIRYAQLLKERGAKVYFRIGKSLHPIFLCCPYIDSCITEHDVQPEDAIRVPLFTLPLLFELYKESDLQQTVPYFFTNKELVNKWQKYVLQKSFNIGLCWRGSCNFQGAASRQKNIHVELFKELAQIPNVCIYNLQKDITKEEKQTFTKLITFDDFDTKHGSFMDTAALIKNLDLVITVDTSVAHLAGAFGIPVWTLLPYKADWRWLLHRRDSPWYPTMKLFQQSEKGNWEHVITKIVTQLKGIT